MSISSSQTCFKEERFSCPLSRFNRRCKKLAACLPPNGSFAKAVSPSHFPPDWRSRILLSHAAWTYFQLRKSSWHTALFCAEFVGRVCLYTRFVNQTCYWKAIQEVMLPERISLRTQKYIVLEEKEVKTSDGLDTIKTSTVWLLLFYNEGKSIAVDRAATWRMGSWESCTALSCVRGAGQLTCSQLYPAS